MRVFPPALVPVLRDRLASRADGLDQLGDDVLVDLLTTVFFAGLETHEGEHRPLRIVFIGRSRVDVVMQEDADVGIAPLYRWKILRFEHSRPFTISELVKLAVASMAERLYTAVEVLDDGRLAIAGLAREGSNGGADPFVEIESRKPGSMSIRTGPDCLVEYERGAMSRDGEEVFTAGAVRSAGARGTGR